MLHREVKPHAAINTATLYKTEEEASVAPTNILQVSLFASCTCICCHGQVCYAWCGINEFHQLLPQSIEIDDDAWKLCIQGAHVRLFLTSCLHLVAIESRMCWHLTAWTLLLLLLHVLTVADSWTALCLMQQSVVKFFHAFDHR